MKLSVFLNFAAIAGFVIQSFSIASFGELKADHLHLASSVAHEHGHHRGHHHEFHKKCLGDHDESNDSNEAQANKSSPSAPASHEHKHSDLVQLALTSALMQSEAASVSPNQQLSAQPETIYASPTSRSITFIFRPPKLT